MCQPIRTEQLFGGTLPDLEPPLCVSLSPPGSRLSLAQEVTPTNSHQRLLRPAASPLAAARRLHSPSPAILNFTLQNLGLIAPSGPPQLQPPPAGAFVAPQTPSGVSPLPQRNMVFIKPVSPLGTPPLTLISLPQVRETQPGVRVRGWESLGSSRFNSNDS